MQKTSLRDILLPTPLEVLSYYVASLLALVLINVGLIIDRISENPLPKQIVGPDDYLGSLKFLTSIPAVNTIVIVAFWSGVGLLAYTLVWAGINAFIEARNEVVVESEYTNKGEGWQRFKPGLLRAGLLAGLITYLILNLKWLLPIILASFSRTIIASGPWVLNLTLPISIMALDLYVLLFLFRLLRNSDAFAAEIWQSKNRI